MRSFTRLRNIFLMLAISAQLLANVGTRTILAASPAQGTLSDIGLADGGVLAGQVLGVEGLPKANETVTISFESRAIVTARTNAEGEFVVAGLRSGVHTVAAQEGVAAFRFWAPHTAPPRAPSRVLLVKEGTVVRGKSQKQHAIAQLLSNPYVLLGAAAVAIIVPAVVNGNGSGGGGSGS